MKTICVAQIIIGDFGACKNLHFKTDPSDPAAVPDAEALAAPFVVARGEIHSSSRVVLVTLLWKLEIPHLLGNLLYSRKIKLDLSTASRKCADGKY